MDVIKSGHYKSRGGSLPLRVIVKEGFCEDTSRSVRGGHPCTPFSPARTEGRRGGKAKSQFLKYTRLARNTYDIIAVSKKPFCEDQTSPCI
jgi:hypothetical protein